jgi:class 3 adenylate cyclase
MARIPILRFGNLADHARQLNLTSYSPVIVLEGLVRGVDNVRHDVYLSSRFCEEARAYLGGLIARQANVADLIMETPRPLQPRSNLLMRAREERPEPPSPRGTPAEFKRLLSDLQVEALKAAKQQGNVSLDLLARLAVVKFLRSEVTAQFATVLERCRTLLKNSENRPERTNQIRDRVYALQVSKKSVLRRAGQEIFETLRDIEKQTLVRMRQSLFGDAAGGSYELFLNRLVFTEDGRDDYLNAEHYVMLGNYEHDPDRFPTMRELAGAFLVSLDVVGPGMDADRVLDGLLNSPENAQELVAGGAPDDSSPRGKAQKALLNTWQDLLESQKVMDYVVASYEAVPLLSEYSPTINAQQLKNALVSKKERSRVESLITEHPRLSPASLQAAIRRIGEMKGADRARIAGRFLSDFMRYHRDLRRLEALNSALDSVNVIGNEKLRELSSLNRLLYEFLLRDEQKPSEDKVVHHVIIKADVRDSTRMTRALGERGLNPASYFSLNFYDPVNKLLPKYGAGKVFIEGDAIILALLEYEGERGFAVSRACVLAKEMVDIVRAYNEESQKAGLPGLELGVGITYQGSPPMYLMDGSARIMISEALNESDRLSACSKEARRLLPLGGPFNVYRFQLQREANTNEFENAPLVYNVSGIQLNAAAFHKLQQEISLQAQDVAMPTIWESEQMRLHRGLVPLEGGLFHTVVVREARVARLNARDFSPVGWSDDLYYEVCTNAGVYRFVEQTQAAKAGSAS